LDFRAGRPAGLLAVIILIPRSGAQLGLFFLIALRNPSQLLLVHAFFLVRAFSFSSLLALFSARVAKYQPFHLSLQTMSLPAILPQTIRSRIPGSNEPTNKPAADPAKHQRLIPSLLSVVLFETTQKLARLTARSWPTRASDVVHETKPDSREKRKRALIFVTFAMLYSDY